MKTNFIRLLFLSIVTLSSTAHVLAQPPIQKKEKEALEQKAREAKEYALEEQTKYREENVQQAWDSYLKNDYEYTLRPRLRQETRNNILNAKTAPQWSQLTSQQKVEFNRKVDQQVDFVWGTPNHQQWRYNRKVQDFENRKAQLIRDVGQTTEKLVMDGVKTEEAYKEAKTRVYEKRDQFLEQAKNKLENQKKLTREALKQYIQRVGRERYQQEQEERKRREAENSRRAEQKDRQFQTLPDKPYEEQAVQAEIQNEQQKLNNIYESAASALKL